MPERRTLLDQCLALRAVMAQDEAERLRRLAAGQPTGGIGAWAWRGQLRSRQWALVRLRRVRAARAQA